MLSGAHMALAPKVVNQLRARNSEIPVVVGGIIPKRDIVKLKALGVRDVLTAGSTPDEVVAVIRRAIEPSSIDF
jgi:methylmalonyl-CoA mutase C-terminal domain/subunit